MRQFKEETRRLSSAKSRVDDAEMAQKTPKLRIREFLRHTLMSARIKLHLKHIAHVAKFILYHAEHECVVAALDVLAPVQRKPPAARALFSAPRSAIAAAVGCAHDCMPERNRNLGRVIADAFGAQPQHAFVRADYDYRAVRGRVSPLLARATYAHCSAVCPQQRPHFLQLVHITAPRT